MDEPQFDQLTKALSNASSRRGFLKVLMGAVGGALGLSRVEAQTGDSDCSNKGQSCTAQKCCGGFTCLIDMTSGTEKFCCPDGDVCGQTCCPTGGVCLGDTCVCPDGETRCENEDPIGTCLNLDTDVNNCGACGNKCPASTDPCGMAACVAGVCTSVPDPDKTGMVCREAAGPCDVAEVCNGTSVECPQDVFLVDTTVCREAAGPCDVPEFCTGTSAQCPENKFLPAGTVCLEAQGPCAGPSLCSGNSATCPENPLLPDTTVCRPAADQCDVAEFCTGTSNQCPENKFKLDGTPCDTDNNLCTLDTCQNGVCQGGPQKTCPVSTDPCKVNVCDPVTGNCITQNAPNGTLCTDNNLCTTGETCQNGTCQGGTQKTCPAGQTCVTDTGVCTCTTGVTCGNICCSGSQGFCCPAGTPKAGQCKPNLSGCS